MNEKPRSRFVAIVAREWWVVLASMLAAGLIAYLVTGTSTTTYVATSTVKVNQPAVSRFPTMLFGDRMLDTLESGQFSEKVAKAAGMDPDTVAKAFTATATGKLLDKISVRYKAATAEDAKTGADALSKGIVAFAKEYNAPELERQKQVLSAGEQAIARTQALQKRIGDDAYKQADIEVQLARLQQEAITNRALYQQALDAYGYDGNVAVAVQTGSSRTDLLAAALLAGLVAGLVIAAVRERFIAADRAA